jgi:hypothetical protein
VWVSCNIIGLGLPTIIGGEIACQPMAHLWITLISAGRHDGAGIKPTANTDIVEALVTGPHTFRDTADEHREKADKRESSHRTVLSQMNNGGESGVEDTL